jgi:23S rRNA (uracil1939-C5)-methyltransferase
MDERINEVLALVQGRCRGMSQLSIRAGNAEPMVQPRLADPGIAVTSGQDHFETEVLGRRFRVAGASFFQVNAGQLGNMIGMLRDRLGLTGAETVVDAYCGVGTFAILLAPYARRVIGIEDSAPAVEDARANSSGLTNIEFIMGRAEEVLARVEGAVDAVILDPPRAGCHPGAIDAVIRLKPARVVLVSCEPSALARDLARLTEGPFILESVQPVDMFPQTRHVEAVAFLKAAS